MTINGKDFSSELIARIRATIAANPDLSRMQLSRRVCEWTGWRSPNGALQEMSCRVALNELQRRGVIELPAARPAPPKGDATDGAPEPFSAPTSVECELSELGAVELVLVKQGDRQASALWNSMMRQHHYLGAGPLCGAQLRYFIQSPVAGILGGLAFSAPARRLAARDQRLGWDDSTRRERLNRVVNNSRFLILPQVKVKNLASHVLAQATKRLIVDWMAHYGLEPVLVETFVEHGRFEGTSYRAANWRYLGQTKGRGRQDRDNRHAVPVKDIYVYPLSPDVLQPLSNRTPQPSTPVDWAEEEFGQAALGDERRVKRLQIMARDFYAQPQASIPQACQTRAKTKAAYRFLDCEQNSMEQILTSHYNATYQRLCEEKVVLVPNDTTSLNYSLHPMTEGLGPISKRREGTVGLLVHDTLTFNLAGTPLGLLDVQCWARDPKEFGKKHRRHELSIEEKESYKWVRSYQAAEAAQQHCPETMFVCIGDREADIYELFHLALSNPQGPELLIRASQDRLLADTQGHLWDHLKGQPEGGQLEIEVPRRSNRPARTATVTVRWAQVKLNPPRNRTHLGEITLWAILVQEINAPTDVKEPIGWLLLTTLEISTFEQATEKVRWYSIRWGIEVYHRTLKSGCKIETRQLRHAERIEACLAIDMIVAWRIYYLTKLGREIPDVPCSMFFEEAEWKALATYITKNPIPPEKPPSLREAIRMVGRLGGFLGRKSDGEPGTKSLWRGLQRLEDLKDMWKILHPPPIPNSHSPPVSSKSCG